LQAKGSFENTDVIDSEKLVLLRQRDSNLCIPESKIRHSNSEMSPQIIPLKVRKDFQKSAELCPLRLFAFELRRWGNAARASCCWDLQQAFCADVGHRAASL